jgi:putative GTP pyrophosphokinase
MTVFDYAAVIRQYKKVQKDYEHLAISLQAYLKKICIANGIIPIISGRAKSLESFAGKICREGAHYEDPIVEITDFCGVRVVVHTLDQVEILVRQIESDLAIDEMNSGDKQELLDLNEFGYLSRHFIVKPGETSIIEGCENGCFRSLHNPRAEIQVRTLAQHVWADVYHELGYKNEFALPARWQREFARLAASLEDCDEAFMNIKHSISTYESNYGAYLPKDELERLVEQLEILVLEDSDNINVLNRLVRTYMALDGKLEAVERLYANNRENLQNNAPALRDIGIVLCRGYPPGDDKFREGLKLIERAVELAPTDVDALSSLGGALRRSQDDEASLDCYRRAHRLDPSNPYPLLNYMAGEISRTGDVSVVQNFYAGMEMAAERCQQQIDVGINLPWSYYDTGQMALYQGRLSESIAWVAKGIDQSSSSWMVSSARKPLKAILALNANLEGAELIDQLLETGERAKIAIEGKSTKARSDGTEVFPDAPILLVVGGCDHMEEGREEQLQLLSDALVTFPGTIVSGGTNVGVSAVVGAVSGNGKPYTIGYLPEKNMSGLADYIDDRYDSLRYTKATGFSLGVALQFWDDFLESGRHPDTLKVVGFNGGKISAAEYRVALAFGAQLGIVKDSGRAADEFLRDPDWQGHPGLHVLEPTSEALKKFLAVSQ